MKPELLSQHSEQDRHVTQTNMKIDTEVAGLKTMLEAHKLDTIKYLAGKNIKITYLQFKNNFKKLYICQNLQSSSSFFFLFHKSGMRLKIILKRNYFMKAQNEAKSTTRTKQNKKRLRQWWIAAVAVCVMSVYCMFILFSLHALFQLIFQIQYGIFCIFTCFYS